MNSNPIQNLQSLFQTARQEGALSEESYKTLTVHDIGAEIGAGLGVSVDDVQSSEVVLVTMMIDDSASIRFSGNTDIVRAGHNEVLRALMASKQNQNILVHTCYLNGAVLFPYVPLAGIDEKERIATGRIEYIMNPDVVHMDKHNYDPTMGTPLYDQTVVLLGRVLAKYQEFAENGVAARTVTLLITDGADEHSCRYTLRQVNKLVTDMLGERHVIAAMGVDNGSTDFRVILREMGIRDEWILTPANTPSDLRRAFQVFSQSAVQISQAGAALFSQISIGGFGH